MENLIIASTLKSPGVTFNTNGDLLIAGKSIPEDSNNYYKPLFAWLEEFKKTSPTAINLTLKLEYMNTSSVRIILKFLQNLVAMSKENVKLKITWVYDFDDDDICEQGEIIQESIKFPIEMIEHRA
jgi:methylthioribose-1-phosphate isomerase